MNEITVCTEELALNQTVMRKFNGFRKKRVSLVDWKRTMTVSHVSHSKEHKWQKWRKDVLHRTPKPLRQRLHDWVRLRFDRFFSCVFYPETKPLNDRHCHRLHMTRVCTCSLLSSALRSCNRNMSREVVSCIWPLICLDLCCPFLLLLEPVCS